MVTERNAQVFAMVESELRQDRTASNDYLFSRAVSIDSSIADLTPQQFNARYPLVVKRRFAREGDPTHAPAGEYRNEAVDGRQRSEDKISPFLADREPRRAASSLVRAQKQPAKRSNGTRRRIARAKVEGPVLTFDDAALRTLLLRLMRDVADASTNPGKLVEVVARVDSYAADVRETARID